MKALQSSLAAAILIGGMQLAAAQQQRRPQTETTKVEGTDNVYIFRNGNHQAMFIVTGEGVIATDPVAYGRPIAAFGDGAHDRRQCQIKMNRIPGRPCRAA